MKKFTVIFHKDDWTTVIKIQRPDAASAAVGASILYDKTHPSRAGALPAAIFNGWIQPETPHTWQGPGTTILAP